MNAEKQASTVAEAVAKYLGGEKVLGRRAVSDMDLAAAVEKRLSVEAIERVMNEGLMNAEEVYHLVIPRRTLTKRRSASGVLSRDESDRLVRIVRVIAIAHDVFGGRGKAAEWIRRPNRALGDRRPIDLLETDNGSRLVETILGRIEYGVYS